MHSKAVTIVGVYPSILETEQILNKLRAAGIRHSDVSCLIPETLLDEHSHAQAHPEQAYSGLQWTDRVGEVFLPGLGQFIGSGPIKAATLHTAKAHETLVSTLHHMGVDLGVAERCKAELERGRILVTIHTHDDESRKKAETIICTKAA